MKADIPDKMIISRDKDGKIHNTYWTTDQELIPFEDTEYVRKDALLEWAKDELKLSKKVECVSDRSYEEGRQQVAQNLIYKLNSL